VGWLIAEREDADLAQQLIADSAARHDIEPSTLTLHADRGTSMRSKPVAVWLGDLDITESHSRPCVLDDNPYAEAQLETLKYQPDFPKCFGCIEDARAYCQAFFHWHNTAHRHSGVGYMTPNSVHHGQAEHLRSARQAVLNDAFHATPNHFKGRRWHPMRCPPLSGSTHHHHHRRPSSQHHHSLAQQIRDKRWHKVIDMFRAWHKPTEQTGKAAGGMEGARPALESHGLRPPAEAMRRTCAAALMSAALPSMITVLLVIPVSARLSFVRHQITACATAAWAAPVGHAAASGQEHRDEGEHEYQEGRYDRQDDGHVVNDRLQNVFCLFVGVGTQFGIGVVQRSFGRALVGWWIHLFQNSFFLWVCGCWGQLQVVAGIGRVVLC